MLSLLLLSALSPILASILPCTPTHLWLQVDQDGSGGINFESFCRLMKDRQRTNDTEADIKMAFQLFDTKNKGYMSRNDLRTLLEYGGEPYPDESFVEDVMQEADETGIGRIDYNQFFQMMGLCELDPQLQQSMKNAGLGLGRSQPHDDDDDDDDVYTEDEEAE